MKTKRKKIGRSSVSMALRPPHLEPAASQRRATMEKLVTFGSDTPMGPAGRSG